MTARIAALVVVLFSFGANAAPPAVAVLPAQIDVSAEGQVPNVFDDHVLSAVAERGVSVIGGDDIQALLSFEEQRQLLDCNESECMTQIAGALGVDKLIAIKVARLETEWAITVKLLDLAGARVEARTNEFIVGDAKALLEGIGPVVARLFATSSPTVPGVGRSTELVGLWVAGGGVVMTITGALLLMANTTEEFDRSADSYEYNILNTAAVVSGAVLFVGGLTASGLGSGVYIDGRAQSRTGDNQAHGRVGFRWAGWALAAVAVVGPTIAALVEFPERYELANLTGLGGAVAASLIFAGSMFLDTGTAVPSNGEPVPIAVHALVLPGVHSVAPGLGMSLSF